VSLML